MTEKASGIACLDYSTKTNNDNFYVCANGINDGKYAYNNLQHYDATWYHKFDSSLSGTVRQRRTTCMSVMCQT